uniref:Uncharacterized protein n=1 Tax=Oryza sativa subsp. japonica TaxID=39947 RepID=Q5Z7P0_ORYSJ|nr:hypothetical protein [Oryza sativa Japonica Group]
MAVANQDFQGPVSSPPPSPPPRVAPSDTTRIDTTQRVSAIDGSGAGCHNQFGGNQRRKRLDSGGWK